MAAEVVSEHDKPVKSNAELLTFIKKELEVDAERHTKLLAAGAGELPQESQTGVTLDLGHKNLRALPLEVIAVIKDKVERLALSHNPQISVPIQIAQCERLRYLNIRWNQLVHFPEAVLQLSQLEILDVSKNRISSIPEDIKNLTSLKFLAVSRNRITRLPYALGDMSSLGRLKFDENPIVFPPPEALASLSGSLSASAFEAEREKDLCQKVKRFLRTSAVKDKLKPASEEDVSESSVETPRPPKRIPTGGRFPIRPSISGLENLNDAKSDPIANHQPPPIPQRSHARGESSSSNASSVRKRPGIAPLLNAGDDSIRSQSEMIPPSMNLRQRRQGFVPSRKPTLGSVSEASNGLNTPPRTDVRHSRAASSMSSILYDEIASGSGENGGSFDFVISRLDSSQNLSMLPGYRHLRSHRDGIAKACKRLVLALSQLDAPISAVAVAIKDDSVLCRSTVERRLFTAQTRVKGLDRSLQQMQASAQHVDKAKQRATNTIVNASVQALRCYGAIAAELKRKRDKIVARADGIYLRSLLFQIYSTMIEARNICSLLGFQMRDTTATASTSRMASQAWSNRSVTPTQPKMPHNRRMAKPPMLQNMNSSDVRVMQPPSASLRSSVSTRTNTMNSQSTTLVSSTAASSRTNTMRSVRDDGQGDEHFDDIFLKLQAACILATQALPTCRSDVQGRIEIAQANSQRIVAHQWSLALAKCDEVIANNKALRKRLEIVKVNDPGIRYHRDFWQQCDAFVHSWTEFATEIRELSSQRAIDISSIKQVMRHVQRSVKDVSKTISNSPLYHQALGSNHNGHHHRGTDSNLSSGYSSPLPSPFNTAYQPPSGYHTSVPATPLSAALGPAVQATVATPNTSVPREYFPQEPPTARPIRDRERDRERYDTPMQYARRY